MTRGSWKLSVWASCGHVVTPMKGLGIGQQLGWLTAQLNAVGQ